MCFNPKSWFDLGWDFVRLYIWHWSIVNEGYLELGLRNLKIYRFLAREGFK